MRYLAPARADVLDSVFAHPGFQALSPHRSLFAGPVWPTIEQIDLQLGTIRHGQSGRTLQFVLQNEELLADGLHYEQRIFGKGQIATRPGSWHDLFNALIWREYTGLKSALNERYVADFPAGVDRERSRAQMAITHFDEAGVVVHLSDPARLSAWDRHDWPAFFRPAPETGRWDVSVTVFGHALLEHLLAPHQLLVGKALVVFGGTPEQALPLAASAISSSLVLNDPQELRPLPLSGIPGWHAGQTAAFYETAACFRPLRDGRSYPLPLDGCRFADSFASAKPQPGA
ncbi:DUF3025 domain-containing protein [Ahniella affigens]|uniref:DUF3025 domain-containing protein n=1 Tax=Ahniella affigens TaxID=2021234 RepID=A0A2P1PW27_9GAMM|nr:DUF3025 domain-containing protein [Ahniella affigens]AVP99040.1 DUF3025 domain-containing protein [Ahniella affigens]